MGLLDDAMIASLVLRRHEAAFEQCSHAYKLRWPLPIFDIDQLLSVVSPLRLIRITRRRRPRTVVSARLERPRELAPAPASPGGKT
jgi:hypothetical protein